jgi:hypothetical protein
MRSPIRQATDRNAAWWAELDLLEQQLSQRHITLMMPHHCTHQVGVGGQIYGRVAVGMRTL